VTFAPGTLRSQWLAALTLVVGLAGGAAGTWFAMDRGGDWDDMRWSTERWVTRFLKHLPRQEDPATLHREVLSRLVTELHRRHPLHMIRGAVAIADPAGEALTVVAQFGHDEDSVGKSLPVGTDDVNVLGVVGCAFKQQDMMRIPDVGTDPSQGDCPYLPFPPTTLESPNDVLAISLGARTGILLVSADRPNVFRGADVHRARLYSALHLMIEERFKSR